jgi:hypothetical protein
MKVATRDDGPGEMRIPHVLAAVERWPQDLIEAALGRELEEIMPELARLTDLRVRVPRFSVVALGRGARREGTTSTKSYRVSYLTSL